MLDKLTVGMKSSIKQDFHDICESHAEYDITDVNTEFDKVVDLIEEDVNSKFEMDIPHGLIEEFVREIKENEQADFS